MADKIDSTAWTGDVDGRARTEGPFNTPETRMEIRRALVWGLIAAGAIGLFTLVVKGLI